MKNSKQLYFEMPNKKALGIEDYIVTNSNNFAFDLIVKMAKGEINFGLISGPPYSGKTHLSKILIKKYNGNVPKDLEALESLPAVGHKTASVVMSQAFGVPSFPVDTHIHRLMYRWGLTSGKNVVQTEKDAKRLFPTKLWNKLHLQIIFYGRERSPARAWNINNDPITQKIGRKSILKKLINS